MGSASMSRPEHLFSCPSNFFNLVTLSNFSRTRSKQRTEDADALDNSHHLSTGGIVKLSGLSAPSASEGKDERGQDGNDGWRWSCNSCRATFVSSDEQRSHFKTDYHRLNVKRRVVGKGPLTEEDFKTVAEGQSNGVNDDVSSISGSDNESGDSEQTSRLPRSSHVYFVHPDLKETFSVWRPVVLGEKEYLQAEKDSDYAGDVGFCVRDDEILLRLKFLICSRAEDGENFPEKFCTWIVLLAAGGHFAGVVVKMENGEVLAHQTFHRYVVRAKAGGRQTTQDNTGRAPKSAGASLRRYNEAALQKEVRNLLSCWGGHLQSASHIFVHAPFGNGQALFGGESPPLNRNDPRIRRIPFTTRRPTYKEAKRVYHMLAVISYEAQCAPHEMTNVITDGREEPANKGLKAVDTHPGKAEVSIISKRLDQQKLIADDVVASPSANALQLSSPAEAGRTNSNNEGTTSLHMAAKSRDCDLVLKLLEDGLDPCVKDEGGYTPYSRAGDKETRNVFRRFMAGHPNMWDWHAAYVPSALTGEMEAAHAAKQTEKDMKRKEREKERKKLKKERERAQEAERKAAKLAATAIVNVQDTLKSSTSTRLACNQQVDFKAQAQEREMRAAAAEARMEARVATMGIQTSSRNPVSCSNKSKACCCCGDSMISRPTFSRLSYQYCSTTCVQVHRKLLEGE